jgi:polyisoprenoid-binding protein YceI
VVPSVVSAQLPVPPAFSLTPFHSQIEFAVPFMGLTHVKGAFEDFTGTLLYDRDRPARSSITVVIRAGSLHTGNATRDRHLMSDDFFDVARYPSIRFQSDGIQPRGGNRYLVHGRLTLHGTTRSIVLPATMRHALVASPEGVDYVGFDLTLRLDWREFGIPAGNANNPWFKPARMLVNDSVSVSINIEAERRAGARLRYPALDAARELVASEGTAGLERRYADLSREHPDSVAAFARPLTDLGDGLMEGGRSAEGVAVLELGARARPDDGDAEAALAGAYLGQGSRDSAVAAYRKAMDLDPDNTTAIEMLRRLEAD